MSPIISISNLTKTYASGHQALKRIDLEIRQGEIFALLEPNGAGKTTLISIVCGIVTPTAGRVLADGHGIMRDYRAARSKIGLVPQELTTDAFESVWTTVSFSRGLFGRAPNPAYGEQVLRDLSLWDKRKDRMMTLSGGMKRRVMIAKALAHEPQILFLDEPTAGVDVELRRDMWALVRRLRASGVTIILTTHYIDEAELILVEENSQAQRTTSTSYSRAVIWVASATATPQARIFAVGRIALAGNSPKEDYAATAVTLEQVAKYLNVGKFTVYRLLAEKRLPAFKVGNQWRFKRKLGEKWLSRHSNVRETERLGEGSSGKSKNRSTS